MAPVRRLPPAAAGFTVKSGWASMVVLAGSAAAPEVVATRRVDLSDPARPEARQPYHDGFGTARVAGPVLAALIAGVRRFGRRSVARALREAASECAIRGAGVVVGSLIDPNRIANAHIRIHALEGRLFRTVVQEAAAESGLACTVWRERDLLLEAGRRLNLSDARVREALTALGTGVSGPWRAEQKRAALAAWLVLCEPDIARANHRPGGRAGRHARPFGARARESDS